MALCHESLPALVALERALVNVRADVRLQVAGLVELLHTGVERAQQAPLLPLGDSVDLDDVCTQKIIRGSIRLTPHEFLVGVADAYLGELRDPVALQILGL